MLAHTCQQKFGVNSAERVSHWNGGDIETKEGVNLIKNIVSEKRSAVDGVSPECGPYSPMQHLNMRTPEQRESLDSKRAKARKQYAGASEIAKHVHDLGLTFIIELSEGDVRAGDSHGFMTFRAKFPSVPVSVEGVR